MWASECPYNTQYPNTPGAIQMQTIPSKWGYSIMRIMSGKPDESPQDMEKLKLSWQGYNYGNGISHGRWKKFGGYSEANALQFPGAGSRPWLVWLWRSEYVPHVMRYYSGGGWFAGLFGNGQLVTIAKSQLGNEGGEKFWSWYGFDSQGGMVCLLCQLVC